MKLYTRAGDDGFTTRLGGKRVHKSDITIEALGTVDELNAHLGLCVQSAEAAKQDEIRDALAPLQNELLVIGTLLATGEVNSVPSATLDDSAVRRMERQIDAICAKLPELKQFILQGGCELSCRLHVARTVCRRAERTVVAASEAGTKIPALGLCYLNRLSDLLFTLARLANHNAGAGKTPENRRA